ncbi:MAG: hypothetical protein A2820_00095 [Candidatus Buchananbacteria bacterium RIFCSPHIGHO2_01_FULL_40_35]|nr:MAG: hypothetical protein A2820_00095 [Candidatus Buchananbacteria bacterium RIFCSPHIGHO2_01_FULL_40_35]
MRKFLSLFLIPRTCLPAQARAEITLRWAATARHDKHGNFSKLFWGFGSKTAWQNFSCLAIKAQLSINRPTD